MLTQNLPKSAERYARGLSREKKAALAAIERLFRRMNPNDFDVSWALIAPQIVAVLNTAQMRVGERADRYIPQVLRELNQVDEPEAMVNVNSFVGVTGGGLETRQVLDYAPVRAKQAVQTGATGTEALTTSKNWLLLTAGTILADTWRNVEGTNIAVRRKTEGYVRMLTPPSCGRCAVLAGKWFRRNTGFQRHPGCDCVHIPSAEASAGDLTLDIGAYFNSLDNAGQTRLVGSKANAQAVRDGADPVQIINAYRRAGASRVLPVAQRPQNMVWESQIRQGRFRDGTTYKYTIEGMDPNGRGVGATAYRRYRGSRNANPDRLMPESIYSWVGRQNLTPTQQQDKIVELLRRYGWIH